MTLTAKYAGRCAACHGAIAPGESIEWDRESKRSTHTRCDPAAKARQEQAVVAVAASRATDVSDVDIPIAEGLAYLPFQRAGIAFALGRPACLIADEMGLGKTWQAAGVINADATIRRVLVICPASLRLNWSRELQRILARPLSVALVGTQEAAALSYDPPAGSVFAAVVTWDSASKLRTAIDAQQWDAVVVDEAHMGKTPTSARSKAVFGAEGRGRGAEKKPADLGIQARRKLALTGTPITNRPAELHPILRWLDGAAWPKFFPFGLRYCAGYKSRWGWNFTGASHLDELQERLRSSVMVRRLKSEVLTELPAKRRQVVMIPANGAAAAVAAEREAWDARAESMEVLRADLELSKASADPADYEAAAEKLQDAQRAAFAEISILRHDVAVEKAPAVLAHATDALEGGTDKLVIMAHHHDVVAALIEGLKEFSPVSLTGETPMTRRQENVDRFQADPSCRVFVGSITVAGVGIKLTASAHVIFAELDWVPGNVTQAEDRLHRIGQVQSVLVQHVVLDGSLDARMVELLISKQDVADRALDRVSVPVAVAPAPASERAATETVRRSEIEETAAKLTTEQVAAVHAALRIVAGRCDGAQAPDGAGYNKVDTRVGKSLAQAQTLTARQAALGLRLVTKYRRQIPSDLLHVAGLVP